MGQILQPVVNTSLHRGMADASAVADSMMPAEQLRLVRNFDADTLGQLKRRKGYSRLGNAQVVADNAILGLQHHVGTNSQIVAFINNSGDTLTESYYLSAGTWNFKALSFTVNTKVRTVTFLDYLMAVNGVNSPKSWSGSAGASWGTTNLTSAPIGSMIEVFRQQVYIGNASTSQVNFSSVPTSGVISWTASDNFIVNPNDGSNLTAMKRYGQELLFFKTNYFYRFNGNSLDADPLLPYGTPSSESVAVTAGTCWFFDSVRQAGYGYAGGFPDWISKPVDSFFKAVPTSNATSVCLSVDTDHVEFHLGDLTVSGVSFVNTSARYKISTQTWVIRNYAQEFRVFTPYDDGTYQWVLGGTTDGNVVKMEDGNADISDVIEYELETQWLTIGNNPAMEFTLASFSAFVENATGNMQVFFKTERDGTWRSIGSCKSYVNSWDGVNARFHRIKFRFIGSSSDDQVIFDGFSLLVPILEGTEKDSLHFNI